MDSGTGVRRFEVGTDNRPNERDFGSTWLWVFGGWVEVEGFTGGGGVGWYGGCPRGLPATVAGEDGRWVVCENCTQ
ncbi:UNVERIFIED_CONTAM: hypothetical protein Sradi_6954300 [Sesamum radiatum]|uniref:Uncharacterized protein n=1 Tax=Sesamum radiatum TaxID=300843 RepID=A0AAW2JEV0_SESRA